MDRIAAIEKSLNCFVCGLVGLLPLLGLFPAVHALVCWRRVRARYGSEWNPAEAYLTGGFVLGVLGVLSSMLFILAVGAAVMANLT